MIVGNDVSGYQGNIDFSTYSKNSNFLLTKVSEGVGFTDPKFLRNQTETRIAGLLLGYYHFARPDLGNNPQSEADYFLKTIGEIKDGEMLCLDYEPASNPGDTVAWCKGFLDRVKEKTGCKPLIYLNQSQVKGFNWKPIVDAGYGLWIAWYNQTDFDSGLWSFAAMQQWTSSQQVPGILGNVDGDWFFGTAEQFKAYGYHKPIVSSPSPSKSPSSSVSESKSPSSSSSSSASASVSPSPSKSTSPSSSPSPSSEPPSYDLIVIKLSQIIKSQWSWFGSKSWLNRLGQLRKILYENNV